MRSKLIFAGLSTVVVAAIVLLFAVSFEKKDPSAMTAGLSPQTSTPTADSAVMVADDLQKELIPANPPAVETAEVSYANVRCLAFWNDRIAAGTEGGVFTYKLQDSSFQFFSRDDGLRDYNVHAILPHEGNLLVGTDAGLAKIEPSGNIVQIDFGINAPVMALAETEGVILIGTPENGLIAYTDGIFNRSLDVQGITSILVADSQIWVGTDGYGLYSYDGAEWKKRFLINDTAAFDWVTALGYKFDRIYVGTPYGLRVFDGGKWDLYNEEDGLLSCNVTAIGFAGWKVIVGTVDWGIYEIFEDCITPKAWSEAIGVSALAINGKTVVMGTPDDGLYIADGNSISHINPTAQISTQVALALR